MQEGERSDSTALASRKIWWVGGVGMIRPPYSCVRTSGAEKELPDAVLRSGLSYGHRRSASAPRRALVVLRTPMDPARVGKKPAKVTITVTGQLCCTQQLVGELGVPVATSHFSLALSRLAPEGILMSA